jgi:peptidoglycan/LPS O-acetylase OafA/YrhL
MLFPLLVGPFFRLKGAGKVLAFAAITGLYVGLMYFLVPYLSKNPFIAPGQLAPPSLNTLTDWGLVRCLAGFLLGMLFYELYRSAWAVRVLRSGWAFAGFAAGLVAAMHFGIHQLLIVCFFPLIILSAAYNGDFVKRALETRPLQRLGDWSFSIYMVHMPILFTLTAIFILPQNPKMFSSFQVLMAVKFPPGLPLCLLLVGLTLLVASLTYHYIEVPARQYLNKLFAAKKLKAMA